jgi:TolB-like protein/class 3 adenylate cyclase
MVETRKIAAILAADIVGYSRLAGADEDRTLARLRALRSDLIDPTIAVHRGRVVKRTGDGILIEFRSVVDAVRCAIEVRDGMIERNAGLPSERRIEFRIGIHLGDVVEEEDGDLMGDGVNIAARFESICEPGGICLSDDAYRQVRDRITEQFVDLGEQTLKNIARTMRAYQIPADRSAAKSGPAPEGRATRLALPDKPSIAVLPFQNMSGDPEQEYFADGMVEDIVTGLSRIKWLFVIARNSRFIYKGNAIDVRQVGRDLGGRYVLEGGVRKAGARVRITAQLLEAETGAHLWADKYDGALEDIFDLQDQITDRVVGIVEPSLRRSEIERSRRKRPENLDAYDLVLRALPHMQARMPEGARIAIPLLEEALSLDPDYAVAHAHLAWCREWCFTRGGLDQADKDVALLHARAAIASDIDDAAALAVAGWVIIVLTKEHEMALGAIERALSLNASCATAHYFAALVNAFADRPAPAAFHATRALRLSPFDPSAFEAHLALGMGAIGEANYDEAASCFARASQINARHSLFPFFQAIALALGGRAGESASLVRRGLELERGFRIRVFSEFGMARRVAEKFAEGARLLGLPE